MIGKRLGHYEVVEKIGEGGMGEVWRARDTTLDRDVALKVLPAHLVADPERIARFDREAKVLASLNHPGIAAIYGFHEADGIRFLAMELAPGPDLSQRIASGPIPVEDALPLAARIAEALEYAHERNIVHRDLKPANVKVHQGTVKVLDFGLAKAFAPEGEGGEPTSTPTLLPTVTSGGTRAGVVLGTAAYMSPEQARGHHVDRRTDIWAFGCLLYEMLTGKRLFPGDTVSDTIAAVLRADLELGALPDATPPAVRYLLERCLDRNPATRLRDIGEARVALENPETSGAYRVLEPGGPAGDVPRSRRLLPVVVAAGVALVLGVALGRVLFPPPPPPEAPAVLFEVTDPENVMNIGELALSPDGSRLIFSRQIDGASTELCLRRLDEEGVRAIPGSQDAKYPFWSPDGTGIAFFIGRELYRADVGGAAPRRIASVPDTPRGGTWSEEDVILIGSDSGPLYRVPASGGTPEPLTEIDPAGEDAHVWPSFLPGGREFVFLADASSDEFHRLRLGSLDGGSRVLRTNLRSAIGVDAGGNLLIIDNSQLIALPFDFSSGKLAGEPSLVADGVVSLGGRHESPFTVSSSDVIAYQTGGARSRLVRYALDGSGEEEILPPGGIRNVRYSPDGTKVAYEDRLSSDERVIWVLDLERGDRTLVSERGMRSDGATWSPDQEWIYYASGTEEGWRVFGKRLHGSERPRPFGAPPGATDLGMSDVSPDGRTLLVTASGSDFRWDLHLGEMGEDSVSWTRLSETPFEEDSGSFSPDGRWISFSSDASGRTEIYIAPREGGPSVRQWMVSVDGGIDAAWGPAGSRIYYRNRENMLMEVTLEVVEGDLRPGVPRPLFHVPPPRAGYVRNVYDISPDGKWVMTTPEVRTGTGNGIHVRTGWRP